MSAREAKTDAEGVAENRVYGLLDVDFGTLGEWAADAGIDLQDLEEAWDLMEVTVTWNHPVKR